MRQRRGGLHRRKALVWGDASGWLMDFSMLAACRISLKADILRLSAVANIFLPPKDQMDYAIRLADQLREHLRALRKQRGLTQAQLGEQLGIGQARVAEIEARPGVVSVDQLMRILSTLGATLVLREEPARQASIRPAGAALPIAPKKGSW